MRKAWACCCLEVYLVLTHMDTEAGFWPLRRLLSSQPVVDGLHREPRGSPLSELNAEGSRVKSPGPGHSLSSWQLCLKIILSMLICEVYIGHGRDCQTKLFMAEVFTCVLPLEHNLQPIILKLRHTGYLTPMTGSFESQRSEKIFLTAQQKQLLEFTFTSTPHKGAHTAKLLNF